MVVVDGSDAIDNWENGRDQLIVPLACRERTKRSAVRKLTWACQPYTPPPLNIESEREEKDWKLNSPISAGPCRPRRRPRGRWGPWGWTRRCRHWSSCRGWPAPAPPPAPPAHWLTKLAPAAAAIPSWLSLLSVINTLPPSLVPTVTLQFRGFLFISAFRFLFVCLFVSLPLRCVFQFLACFSARAFLYLSVAEPASVSVSGCVSWLLEPGGSSSNLLRAVPRLANSPHRKVGIRL